MPKRQDGDPKVQKKPGMKRPAAAKAKAKGTPDAKPSAEVFKRPSAASGKKTGHKAPAASACLSKEEQRKLLLAQIPSKLKARYKDGCATCRFRPGCCNSCWRKRGFQL